MLIGLAGAVLAGTAVLAGISGWQPTGDNGRPDTSVAPNDDRSPRIGSEVEEPEEALQDKAPDASADTTAVIFLLQGVPGLEADVYLDGQAIASGSPFGWTEGPFEIEPGEHEIALYRASELPPASAKGRTDEPIQAATFSLGPDVTTVVPHLTQSGAVTVSTFTEPLEAGDAIGPGPPRIAIRHLAAAGEIAMFVNGEFADRLAPGQELVVGVEPGDVLVELRQEESIVVSETLSTTGGGLTTLSWIGGNDDSPTGDLILDRPFRPNPETDG